MSENIARTSPQPLVPLRLVTVLAVLAALGLAIMALSGLHAGAEPTTSGFNALHAIAGLLVGVLVGLTGVGGGSLMTPLLVLLFGFHPSTAVGTDLLYASATKSVGTAVHGANKTIDWKITGLMALGSVPATAAAVLVLDGLHQQGNGGSKLISAVLGSTLLLSSAMLLFRGQMIKLATRHAVALGPRTTMVATVVLGAVLGVLITLSSVGAGAIGVTLLIFLYPKMPVARIVGSDIAHAVPLTLIAGVGHWMLGSVNFPLLGSLLVGSIPGIIIGSQLTARVPERFLRPVLAITLLLVGAKFVF